MKKDQTETWERIKDDIHLFCEDCNQFAASLDTPVELMSESQIRRYVETYNRTHSELETRANNIRLTVTGMSEFISAEIRNDALFCIEKSMESCADVFRLILQMWVISGGM